MSYSGFNPKARWDRHLPEDQQVDPTNLQEKIDCLALFSAGKIYPRAFHWKNKPYKIEKITYRWQERRGQEIISYFTVTAGTNLYQISFNNTSLGWRLDKIIS